MFRKRMYSYRFRTYLFFTQFTKRNIKSDPKHQIWSYQKLLNDFSGLWHVSVLMAWFLILVNVLIELFLFLLQLYLFRYFFMNTATEHTSLLFFNIFLIYSERVDTDFSDAWVIIFNLQDQDGFKDGREKT